jgi:hypothetical protein
MKGSEQPRYDLSLSEHSSSTKRKRTDGTTGQTRVEAKVSGPVAIMAICENRTREVGVALINLKSPHLRYRVLLRSYSPLECTNLWIILL